MTTDDPLRRALLSALGARPSPAKRRSLAAQLRDLADEQERLAEAETNIGHHARAAGRDVQNAAKRASGKGGRPKGSGGRFVRYIAAPGPSTTSGQLHIAPALYQELGEPKRLDPQRAGGHLVLLPAEGDAGYAVTFPTGKRGGLPRLSIGQAAAEALRLVGGRHAATVRGGQIEVGDAQD